MHVWLSHVSVRTSVQRALWASRKIYAGSSFSIEIATEELFDSDNCQNLCSSLGNAKSSESQLFSLSQRKVHVKYFRNLKRMKLIYAFTRIVEHWPSGVTTEILFFWETHQSLDFPFSHSSSRIHILECFYITTTCVPYSMTCLEYRPVEAVLVRALMHRCPLFFNLK